MEYHAATPPTVNGITGMSGIGSANRSAYPTVLTDLNKTYMYNAKFTQFLFDLLDETKDVDLIVQAVEAYFQSD